MSEEQTFWVITWIDKLSNFGFGLWANSASAKLNSY
jgi:hypothetical protein